MNFDLKRIGGRDIRRPQDVRNVEAGVELIRDALQRAGATGFWSCRPTVHVSWRSDRKLIVRGLNIDRMMFSVRCKPGDNGSVWEFDVLAPQGMDKQDLRDIHNRMISRVEVAAEPVAKVVEESPEPIPVVEHFPAPEPEPMPKAPEPVVTQTAPLKATEMSAMMSKLGASIQRAANRERQITELENQLSNIELEMEDLMKQEQDVRNLLKQLREEDANDTEAQGARQVMALLKQVVA